jgi:hypothetical protein
MPLTIARGKRPSPAGAAEKGQRMPLESLLISFAISSGHIPDGSFRRMAVRITLRCEGDRTCLADSAVPQLSRIERQFPRAAKA